MKKGFTLVELLIVIAIIGVLATVVVTSALPARYKANNAKALTLMENSQKSAALCLVNEGSILTTLNGPICAGTTSPIWPDVELSTLKATSGGITWILDTPTFTPSTSRFKFVARAPGAGLIITCEETGCTKTGSF